MAFKYAKLWADGYDWRDVFRQPRERELLEVIDEGVRGVRSLFDSKQRNRLREERHARKIARRSGRSTLERPVTSTGNTAPRNPRMPQGSGRSADLIAH